MRYPLFLQKKNTYTLSNILYLGEPSGNIISNYHGTFIHIFMHVYYPIHQKKNLRQFSHIHARKSVS